jgi:hypothetical protein
VIYTDEERAAIEAFFERATTSELRYVVPRGYQNLPEEVPGGDVDVVVHEDDYAEAIRLCERVGFEATSVSTRLTDLAARGLQNYGRVVQLLVSDPRVLYDEVRSAVWSTDPEERVSSSYDEFKGFHGDAIVHLANHLAYTSPMNGQKVRVDPLVERRLHERSRVCECVRVPDPPDELAHLLCRGVFDNEGEFPDYYVEWCEQLRRTVLENPRMEAELDELLSLLFFAADTAVKTCLEKSEYDEIKRRLLRFSGY